MVTVIGRKRSHPVAVRVSGVGGKDAVVYERVTSKWVDLMVSGDPHVFELHDQGVGRVPHAASSIAGVVVVNSVGVLELGSLLIHCANW